MRPPFVKSPSKFCGTAYDRFRKDKLVRFERIFVGKIGELVLSTYLHDLGIQHDTSTMFAVFPGTTNVDPFDFVVPSTDEKIDVKTAYRDFHRRILIPYGPNGQWEQMPKDYYVGVKLHRVIAGSGRHARVDIAGKQSPYALLFGYVSRIDPAWQGPTDFGEGRCMWAYLERMRPIQELIDKMRP